MDEKLKQIQSEIDAMNSDIDETIDKGESMSTDPPPTSAPGTDAPSTESPSTSAPSTSAPTTDAPVEEDERDKTIAELRAKLAEKETSPSTTAPSTTPPIEFQQHDFISDEQFDEITTSKEAFNKFLNTFYQKTISDSRQILGEGVLRSIPDVLRTNFQQMIALHEMRKEFYSNNKDLIPYAKVVASTMEEVAAKNPDKSYDELMNEVATETRKKLNLQTQATNKDEKGETVPRLPRAKRKPGRSSEPPPLNQMQQEIDAMNELDNF